MWYQTIEELSRQIKNPEIIATSYWFGENLKYVVTKNVNTSVYFLYEYNNETGKLVKTKHKAKTPTELEVHIDKSKE